MPVPPPPSGRRGRLDDGRQSDSGRAFSVDPGTGRSARLQEHMREQGQESQALQGLLRDVMEELASVRRLVQFQHEQILQRLPPLSSMLACTTNQPLWQGQVDVFKPAVQPYATNGQQAPVRQNDENVPFTVEFPETQQATRIVKGPKGEPKTSATKSSSHGKGVLLDVSKLPQAWTVTDFTNEVHNTWHGGLKNMVRSDRFDAFFVAVIFINLLTMCVSLQWRGYYTALKMGEREDDNNWEKSRWFFEVLEWIYTTIFLVEAVLRILFLGREYFNNVANCFDTVIVIISCINTYVLQPLQLMGNASFVAVARLVRLVRVMRFLKVVRFAEACAELRILARALSGCAGSLFWSMILLLALIIAGAVLISQLTLPYIEDVDNPEEERRWLYDQFGTIPLAMMALWECTFTGSWHRYSRRMIINQSQYFAFFWVPFILFINFSVMRLIGALFLKETMAVASIDAEKMSLAKVKRQRTYAQAIHNIFNAADEDGDGMISASEFEAMLYNEMVGECFEKLELEVSEVAMLFELLASDDGCADYGEFLEGALKLKQTAQIIDIIQLMHDNQKHAEALQTVYLGLVRIAGIFGISLNTDALAKDLDPSDMRHLVHHSKAQVDHHGHPARHGNGIPGHVQERCSTTQLAEDFADLGAD